MAKTFLERSLHLREEPRLLVQPLRIPQVAKAMEALHQDRHRNSVVGNPECLYLAHLLGPRHQPLDHRVQRECECCLRVKHQDQILVLIIEHPFMLQF